MNSFLMAPSNTKVSARLCPIQAVSLMLYDTRKIITLAKWGKNHEDDVIFAIINGLGVKISKCGLFIDLDHPYLCTTPDGLIGDDGTVELKCLYSARDMTPDEEIFDKLINVYKLDKKGEMSVNKKHPYFYQIQGNYILPGENIAYLAFGQKKESKAKKSTTIKISVKRWCKT